MAESTHHDRTLAELVNERNNMIHSTVPTNHMAAEGHVFDHEPGYADYHHDEEPHHDDYFDHQVIYGEAQYALFLDHQNAYGYDHGYDYGYEGAYGEDEYGYHSSDHNEADANPLYHGGWPTYSPIAPHDWMLHTKESKTRSFDDFSEAEFDLNGTNQVEDGLDFVQGLRRMSFEGLKDKDRATESMKAAVTHQPCKCVHGMEECCAYETHEHEELVEYFRAPVPSPTYQKAHYCISGDEPECDHLREEEQIRRMHRQAYHGFDDHYEVHENQADSSAVLEL